jgi:hypothetical protein
MGWLSESPATWVIWIGAICGIAALLFEVAAVIVSTLRTKVTPKWRLRQKVTSWLVSRHWLLETNTSPSLYFGLWASELDHPEYKILICRSKSDSGLLSFSARVPLNTSWLRPLAKLPDSLQQVLIQDIGVLMNTMQMGFASLEWPLDKLAIQTAMPIDSNLSEHTVDMQGKAVTHAIIGARRVIRRAVITQSASDTVDSQTESTSELSP